MPALSPDSLIVITGITGYIAAHIGLAALKAGHRVRGTVRSLGRGEPVKAAYIKQGITDIDTRLEFVVIDNLHSEEQFQKAIDGADGIAHSALDLSSYGDLSFIDATVKGMLALLRAAQRVPSIKRVVITSSSAAVITPPSYRDEVLTDKDWNDEAVSIVEREASDAPALVIYSAGKTMAEKAAWEFIRNEKPQFDLVSTLPDTNIGPVLHGQPTSTAGWVSSLLRNDATAATALPPQWYIDVRDDGRLHVLALTTPHLGGKRIWAAAAPFGWNQILAIFRTNFPRVKLPDDFKGRHGEPDTQRIDNGVAREVLGGWIPLEQSLVDLAKSLGY